MPKQAKDSEDRERMTQATVWFVSLAHAKYTDNPRDALTAIQELADLGVIVRFVDENHHD